MYNVSFKVYSKTYVCRNNEQKKRNNDWFDDECRKAINDFSKQAKPAEENRLTFLTNRNTYASAKRKAQRTHEFKQGRQLSSLSKTNPQKFWKLVKDIRSVRIVKVIYQQMIL